SSSGAGALLVPGEEHAHLATYMAFASDADGIWTEPSRDNAGLARVRADLIDVAKAIGTGERVIMLVLSDAEKAIAEQLMRAASASNPDIHDGYARRREGTGGVEFVVVPDGFNDYWTRDTAPVFARDMDNPGRLAAISFNFNGWGNANSRSREAPRASNGTKAAAFYQPFENDRKLAGLIAARHDAELIASTLTLEGGALELDGEGTAILTASSVLHVNRNPHLFDLSFAGPKVTGAVLKPTAKATVEAELGRVLGVTKVIWLTGTDIFPGIDVDEESDITNGHVDFYAKFVAPGVVAYALDSHDSTGEREITLRHRRELEGQTDAAGRELTLVPLVPPEDYGLDLTERQAANFAAGYINFYICNGAIILPKFGDEAADRAAAAALAPYRGQRTIVQVDITGIGSGGGGLHCATMQVPA
ncbi:MAG: agmatine deiminase family protein, partial [Rhizobiaceae bacterium]